MTGCPSLSSSDEEEDSGQFDIQCGLGGGGGASFGTSGVAGAATNLTGNQQSCVAASTTSQLHKQQQQPNGSRETLNNPSNNNSFNSKMSGRYSDYSEETVYGKQLQLQLQHQQQHPSSRHLPQTTKISITAPSPRGSIREVNRASNESQTLEPQMFALRRHHHHHQQQQLDEQTIIDRTSELSLGASSKSSNQDDHHRSRLLDQDNFDQDNNNGGANHLGDAGDHEHSDDLDHHHNNRVKGPGSDKSRSQLIDELLRTINDDSFNDFVDFNNKFSAQTSGGNNSAHHQLTAAQLANSNRPKSAIDGIMTSPSSSSQRQQQQQQQQASGSRPSSLALDANKQHRQYQSSHRASATPSTFDNMFRRMSTNFVQGFNKMGSNLSGSENQQQQQQQQQNTQQDNNGLRREKSSTYANNLYVDNQVPARRHSDNTINIPRIQVALSSPQTPRPGLNQRASVSASKIANKWKLTAKTNQREASDKLSPSLGGALGYMRRHSSGNTTGNEQSQSNGQTSHLLLNTSPFKVSLNAPMIFTLPFFIRCYCVFVCEPTTNQCELLHHTEQYDDDEVTT